MSNSYRIRTEVGVDKSLKVLLEQEYEYLEILSLKVLQSQIYTRQCSDYGVIIGRVTANNGFGIPNAKVSVFIPLSTEDENNPIISELYPYKSLSDVNEDGYRYNLLPYKQQHSGHSPTGTFFDKGDVLTNPTLIEVYDKYYRYTAKTNDSGDYMIFGVPLGEQTIHVDVDLSDIGEFSLSPQDLVRTGVATEAQVAGTQFKSSSNLNSLPQIISINRVVEVEPLWGQPEVCSIGIIRSDFDLTSEANIDITPTAIFMGSIVSTVDNYTQKRNCKPKNKHGNLCSLVAGPGEILAIRQTIQQDVNGRPVLETFDLEQGGQVIDENGTWLVDVPMNLDYYITNEFGEKVLSNDPKKGVPTRAKYRFKVKWSQAPTLSEPVKRGYFLVPNIKEHGWVISGGNRIDPLTNGSASPSDVAQAIKSYSFSLDWNDYPDIQGAIDCEDTFYDMQYNKVYTVSQLIDQYRKGFQPSKVIGVKHILDDVCESENVKFPTNDAFLRFDLIYLLFTIMMYIFKPILYIILVIVHVLAFLIKFILGPILAIVVAIVFVIVIVVCQFINAIIWVINLFANVNKLDCPTIDDMTELIDKLLNIWKLFTKINLPNLSYSDCELCNCKEPDSVENNAAGPSPTNIDTEAIVNNAGINSYLTNYLDNSKYTANPGFSYPSAFETMMAGASFDGSGPKTYAPQMVKYGEDSDGERHLFTSSLTLPERINLFNNKAKYFNDGGGTNPGGGFNRIKVTFNTTLNNPLVKSHLDNVVVVSIKDTKLSEMQAGQIIAFQNPELSTDVNLTGFTQLNQFATKSITGTSINDNGQITVYYTDPSDLYGTSSPQSVIYDVEQNPDDATYAKFAMDMEYFQVITAMTYNDFSSLCTSNPLSLRDRYLFNDMRFEYLKSSSNCWYDDYYQNPLASYDNYGSQVITFLVRGVDPYSTRQQNSYDLSRLFGYTTWGVPGLTITGEYKLNHPIRGGVKSVKHTMTSDVTNTDSNNYNLYYDSFHFVPESNPANAGFTAFTSTLPSYYSSLDTSNLTFTPSGALSLNNVCYPTPYGYGAASVRPFNTIISDGNGFLLEWDVIVPLGLPPNCTEIRTATQNSYPNENRGYFQNEIVEGGSVMLQRVRVQYGVATYAAGYTYAPKYSTVSYGFNNLGPNGNQIIMRSDRLPTSTSVKETSNNSFALQMNPEFAVYLISDDGSVPTVNNSTEPSTATGANQDSSEENNGNPVLDSFNCPQMVPLGCYYGAAPGCGNSFTTSEIAIKPAGDGCYENGVNNELIMVNGCYVTVTSIFLSLPKDFEILTEWSSRLLITFGACRDVWSQMFTNNWINGTLYAFAFKNDRFFTGPTDTPPNSPYSLYCRDTVYLHPTTLNFYYRSSPWDGSNFIGADPPTGFFGSYGGNNKNLRFPTTMLDMGPRTQYLQELVMSDDFDGYVVNNLGPTTYTDISEILNLFIISRLSNTNFLQQLFGTSGANILSYFNARSKFMVDADYAQAVSVSSELGVNEFNSENYPQITCAQDPVYFNGADSADGIIGIFFSSDTQVRDFITPKRTIIVEDAMVTDDCAFGNFKVFSQVVPFYQWNIKQNSDQDSIFGSQSNDWYTNPLSSSFYTNRYQSLDRLETTSRYVRTSTSSFIKDFKGYIYSYDTSTNQYNPNPNSIQPNAAPYSSSSRIFTVGAPFHFYFGLKKGKTAFDRFAAKWIKTDIITD